MAEMSSLPPSVAGKAGGKSPGLSSEEHDRYQCLANGKVKLNLVEQLQIPARGGRAFQVSKGFVLRVTAMKALRLVI